MENKNISQIVLERIKEEGIKPISRNVFSMKRVFFWVAVAISFIVGAFVFSISLSALFNNDWYLYGKFGLNFIWKTLPYFWIISFAVFILLGEFYYRKTLLGHRRGLLVIVGVYLISTTLFGSIFYVVGFSESLEEKLENNMTSYRRVVLNRYDIWSHPEIGLLSGTITKIGENEIEIVDIKGNIWTVETRELFVNGSLRIAESDRVKVIGKILSNNVFYAEDIRLWRRMR